MKILHIVDKNVFSAFVLLMKFIIHYLLTLTNDIALEFEKQLNQT
mgnify:FL=1